MQRFETQYPLNARSKEIKQILQYVARGQSCQLISVPGAGRSTVLRLLAYHGKLRERHLSDVILRPKDDIRSKDFLFVYVNFAELPSFEAVELTKALFLAILAAIREQGVSRQWATIGKEIYAIFKEALSLNDPLVTFQALKRALTIEQFNNIAIVFLFDRFSEFAQKLTSEFFSNLKALRTTSSGKLAIVFSTHRPLEELLNVNDFYEYYAGNHVFLEMYDKAATDFRVSIIEKEYNKKLASRTREELIKLTGGYGKLVKLSTQTLLSEDLAGQATRDLRDRLTDFLLSHILIKRSLLEVWQSLTREEQQTLTRVTKGVPLSGLQGDPLRKLGLPFPLLTEFIRRKLEETLVPKTIRFDARTNEIYFGDEPIEGLTAQEFRLLKYLINTPSRVLERDEVINAVWADTKTQAGVSDEALDQMMHRVRKKIEDEADNPKHLLTVKGRGFRFIP